VSHLQVTKVNDGLTRSLKFLPLHHSPCMQQSVSTFKLHHRSLEKSNHGARLPSSWSHPPTLHTTAPPCLHMSVALHDSQQRTRGLTCKTWQFSRLQSPPYSRARQVQRRRRGAQATPPFLRSPCAASTRWHVGPALDTRPVSSTEQCIGPDISGWAGKMCQTASGRGSIWSMICVPWGLLDPGCIRRLAYSWRR